METKKTTYPQSLAGRFRILFTSLKLLPIRLINTKPTDHALKEIRLDGNGIGEAVFENGHSFVLDVRFDEKTCTYLFEYGRHRTRQPNHSFQVLSDLSCSICPTTDITSWVDLSQLSKSEIEV